MWVVLFLSCYTLAYPQGNQGTNYNPNYKYSIAELQSDFVAFRWILEQAHPGLYTFTPKTWLNKQMDSTYNAINRDMTEREFYQMLAPIVANLHCGHTLLDPSLMYQDRGKRFPFDLYFQAGKAFLRTDYSKDTTRKAPIGAELLAINGQKMQDIVRQMLPSLPADGLHLQGKYQDLEEDFGNYYDLLVAQPDTFRLTCLNPKTNEILEYIAPALDDDLVREYSKRYVVEAMEGKKPLEFKLIDSLQTAVMYIHSFLDLDHKDARQKFGKFLKKSFKTIHNHKITHLIIDVRQNSGGNLAYVNHLFYQFATKEYRFLDRVEVTRNKKITELNNTELSKATLHDPSRVIAGDSGRYLARESCYTDLKVRKPNPKAYTGKVFLLIGKRSFSAASHLATVIEAYKRGVLVGEETGGSNAGFNAGDIVTITLPITNLQLEVPIEKCIKIIPRYPHKNRGVMPHHSITNTIEDELTGFDRVLQYTLELIRKKR